MALIVQLSAGGASTYSRHYYENSFIEPIENEVQNIKSYAQRALQLKAVTNQLNNVNPHRRNQRILRINEGGGTAVFSNKLKLKWQ